jgi:hypothetical protein
MTKRGEDHKAREYARQAINEARQYGIAVALLREFYIF